MYSKFLLGSVAALAMATAQNLNVCSAVGALKQLPTNGLAYGMDGVCGPQWGTCDNSLTSDCEVQSGQHCDMQCKSGYTASGVQPSCCGSTFDQGSLVCSKNNVCTCTGGTATVFDGTDGTLCDTDSQEDCSECGRGYTMSAAAAAGSAQTCVQNTGSKCSTTGGSASCAAAANMVALTTPAGANCAADPCTNADHGVCCTPSNGFWINEDGAAVAVSTPMCGYQATIFGVYRLTAAMVAAWKNSYTQDTLNGFNAKTRKIDATDTTDAYCAACNPGTSAASDCLDCLPLPYTAPVTCGDGTWKNSNACTTCDPVTNAATVTCSAIGNSVAATCIDGFWKNSNACTACDPVTNAATVTCSATGNSVAATCIDGFWKNSNACTACDPVTNAATVTCSATGNSVAATCIDGFWKNSNACMMMCGDGTTLTANKCEMDSPLVTCGDGTTLTDNKCGITSPTDDALAKMCGEGTTFDKAKKKCVTDTTSRCTPGLTNATQLATTDKSEAADESAGSNRFVSRTATLTATVIIVLFYKL